jgi:hypothetical protein
MTPMAPIFSGGEKRNRFVRFFILFVIFFALFPVQPTLAGKGPYPAHAAKMAQDAIAIMVEKNECESVNDCRVKDRLKYSGDSEHVWIFVYEAGNLKRETTEDLIRLCIQKHEEYDQRYEIKLLFYKETLEKENHDNFLFWGPVKPFMELKLSKGDEQ